MFHIVDWISAHYSFLVGSARLGRVFLQGAYVFNVYKQISATSRWCFLAISRLKDSAMHPAL